MPVRNHGLDRKWAQRILTLMFGVIIFLPLILGLLRLNIVLPVDEKRRMSPRPEFPSRPQAILDFPKRVEAWFNDHFACRTVLVYAHNFIRSRIPGLVVAGRVLVGRGGWYFITARHTIDDYRGLISLEPDELESIGDVLEERRRWCKSFGIPYYLVIAPAKWEIYPEQMPRRLNRSGRPSTIDQVLRHLNQQDGFPVLDLRESLRGARASWPIYRKAGTHWTELGQFVAQRALARMLHHDFPAVSVPRLSDYTLHRRKPPAGPESTGDLSRMMGLQGILRPPRCIRLEAKDPSGTMVESTDSRIPYWNARFERSTGSEGLRAVVFCDSFGKQSRAKLARVFRECLFVDSDRPDARIIEREKPDLVIQETGQRDLRTRIGRNPPGISGFLTPVQGREARVDFPPRSRLITFTCRSLRPGLGRQFVSLKINRVPAGRYEICPESRTITCTISKPPLKATAVRVNFFYVDEGEPQNIFGRHSKLPLDLSVVIGGVGQGGNWNRINDRIDPLPSGVSLFHLRGDGTLRRNWWIVPGWSRSEKDRLAGLIDGLHSKPGYLLLAACGDSAVRNVMEHASVLGELGLDPKAAPAGTCLSYLALVDLERDLVAERFGPGELTLETNPPAPDTGMEVSDIVVR